MEGTFLMGLATWFSGIAGGRRDLLVNTPADRIRYAAMGGVILTTAAVAAISGASAVSMSLHLSWGWSVLIGLLWGVVIFNLDRLLVTQMARPRNGIRQPVLLALPRLVLAVILGFVISTPLVLLIFDAEIQQELGVIHQQELSAYTAQVDATTYKSIPTLTTQRDDAQQVVSSGTAPSVDDNADVKAAQARLATAETAYEQAEENVVCEKEGTCGSGKAGAGIAYREKVGIRDDAKTERDAAQRAVDQIRISTAKQLNDSYANSLSSAQATISSNAEQLVTLTAQRKTDLANQQQKIDSDTGLLARLEALSTLSANRPMLKVAHWMLFALFLSIEVLPVLTKLLQVIGPETVYDQLAASSDVTVRKIHRRSDAARMKVHRSQQAVELRLERDRARRALSAGKKYNRKLTKTQQDVISAALDAWSQHALDSSRQALVEWGKRLASSGRRHSDPPFVQPVDIAVPPGSDSSPNAQVNGQAGVNGQGDSTSATQSVSPDESLTEELPQVGPDPQEAPVSGVRTEPDVTTGSRTQPTQQQAVTDPIDPAPEPVDSGFDPVQPDLDSMFDDSVFNQRRPNGEPVSVPSPRQDPESARTERRGTGADQGGSAALTGDDPQGVSRSPGRHARPADEVYDQEADQEPPSAGDTVRVPPDRRCVEEGP